METTTEPDKLTELLSASPKFAALLKDLVKLGPRMTANEKEMVVRLVEKALEAK